MPIKLYRRKGTWHYRGTIGPNGKRQRVRGSCKTSEKDIAARFVATLEKKYWDGHFDGPGAVLTFRRACMLYKAAGKSDQFLEGVEKYLGNTLVKDITSGAIRTMAIELFPNMTGASRNRSAIVPTQAVINFNAESGLCAPIKVKRFPEDRVIKEPATLDWIKAFTANAAPHCAALAWFMYLTGARVGEALAVRWEDIDLAERTVLLRQSKVRSERVAHLPPPLVVALANLKRLPGRGVFGYARGGMRKAWEGAIERAGIKYLSPHSCRHGFATGLLRRGIDVMTVAKLGGWSSAAQVLATYGHAIQNRRLTDVLIDAVLTQEDSQNAEFIVKSVASGD